MKLIELHILQSFGPNVMNRDDVGDPKSCIYGGVRRGRISSQSLKFAIRHGESYRQYAEELAPHTRQLLGKLQEGVVGATDDDFPFFQGLLDALFGADKAGQLKTTTFVSPSEIAKLVAVATELLPEARNLPTGKEGDDARKALCKAAAAEIRPSELHPDVALFGRFLASDRDWDVAAATQYSHAISVHRCDTDIDFFTAYDDFAQESSHLDHQGFNAPTYYRYAALDVEQLRRNLAAQTPEDMRKTVMGWLCGTVLSVPSGKQNAFAAFNPPDFVLATVSRGQQRNLLGAFEVPVRAEAGGTGILGPAVKKLLEYKNTLGHIYGQDVVDEMCLTSRTLPDTAPEHVSLSAMGERLVSALGRL